jgi:SM-20-related protein
MMNRRYLIAALAVLTLAGCGSKPAETTAMTASSDSLLAASPDAIAWIDPEGVPLELAELWATFLALRHALNRKAYLGLDRVEVQVARYPGGGAAYDRHRDAFMTPPGGRPNRRVTAIYYANPAWAPEDGGAIRLHGADGPTDLAPILDRLLVFLSERVEHEVLPAQVPRCAVTAWFRPRDPLGG